MAGLPRLPTTVPAPARAAPNAGMHADCTFANLGGTDSVGCEDCSAAVNSAAVSVTVVNSTFFDVAPFRGATYVRTWGEGRVLLSGCAFAPTPDKAPIPFYAEELSTIYADNESMLVRTDTGVLVSAASLSQAEVEHPNTSSTRFLRRDDPWFVRVRRVRPSATLPILPPHPSSATPVAGSAVMTGCALI